MRSSIVVLGPLLGLLSCDAQVSSLGLDDGGGSGGGSAQLAGDLPCDVAGLVSTKCVSCHGSPQQNAAPFPLLSHADFAALSQLYPGSTIAQRSLTRMQAATAPMPPSYAAQPTPAEVGAFAAWVAAGLPPGSCAGGSPDAGPIVLTCASGSHWSQGNLESPVMNPGLACRACHLIDEPQKAWAFMGTVYPALHEENLCNAQGLPADAVVEILDGAGTVRATLYPNSVGNFYSASTQPGFTLPYRARVRGHGQSSQMMTAQTDGDCNGCHSATGANSAPGRIVVP